MRSCGTLLHITSLPSNYGIGTLGKAAYDFIDFLRKSGQTYWQILPIGPTSFGDSPYQSFSAFAGNPLFIDVDLLINDGILAVSDLESIKIICNKKLINYGNLFDVKYDLLRRAFVKFVQKNDVTDYNNFVEKNKFWLEDYALFMAIKYHFHQLSWLHWPDDIRLKKPAAVAHFSQMLASQIEFWKFIQFEFFGQWKKLRNYASQNGVKIFGDIPIYVSMDSADIWANSSLFQLDTTKRPQRVSGCPPDSFSANGQLWGNPLYDWKTMRFCGYNWWIERIRFATSLFDLVRIDHFRAFDSYYSISITDKTAENGTWHKGPGIDFFEAVKNALGKVNFVAEELGITSESVRELLATSDFPGMNMLEFAYDKEYNGRYMPYNYTKKSVAYIGTHDNDTAIGYLHNLDRQTFGEVKKYLSLSRFEGYSWGMIRELFASPSELAIVQMQDFLCLNSSARMNIPSTIGGNWVWRMKETDLSDKLAKKIHNLVQTYFRQKA
ncbi:MAG: 4-alpha-glucanotransferase [Oscillospiraceae bacterium]